MYERTQVAEVYNRSDMVEYYDLLATRYGIWESEEGLLQHYFVPPALICVAGCGTGREVFPLQQQGFRVVGFDIAHAMLCRAINKQHTANSEPRVGFHQGDVVNLPYQDEVFDHVLMISQTIQHIPKRRYRQQAIREIYRVLKPGGYCILSGFNKPISLLYVKFLTQQAQDTLYKQSQRTPADRSETCQTSSTIKQTQHWLRRGIGRIRRRIVWEYHPSVHSYSDPLPFVYRTIFSFWCALTNVQRRMRAAFRRHSEHLLEANDFFLDFPDFQFHLFSRKGELFTHFPDADEIIADIAHAGLRLVEYRSLEELQQGVVFSEKHRRSKRLLFYVAQKT